MERHLSFSHCADFTTLSYLKPHKTPLKSALLSPFMGEETSSESVLGLFKVTQQPAGKGPGWKPRPQLPGFPETWLLAHKKKPRMEISSLMLGFYFVFDGGEKTQIIYRLLL